MVASFLVSAGGRSRGLVLALLLHVMGDAVERRRCVHWGEQPRASLLPLQFHAHATTHGVTAAATSVSCVIPATASVLAIAMLSLRLALVIIPLTRNEVLRR